MTRLKLLTLVLSINTSVAYTQEFVDFDPVYNGDVAFSDIDGDNDPDLLITGFTISNIAAPVAYLYENNGLGNFTKIDNTPFIGVKGSTVTFADFDNDLDKDVIVTGLDDNSNTSAILYKNDGDGNFTIVENTPFIGIRGGAVATADTDNDGDLDILISGYTEAKIFETYFYENLGELVYMKANILALLGIGNATLDFADIDKDGDQDLLMTGQGNQQKITKMFLNDGHSNFEEIGIPFEIVQTGDAEFADIDNDDDMDILITGWGNNGRSSTLYKNNGSGGFYEVFDSPFIDVYESSIAFLDSDNDTDKDIMITGSVEGGQETRLYHNYNGKFVEINESPFIGVKMSSIAIADVDMDDKLDVLITGLITSVQPISRLYKNLSVYTSQAPLITGVAENEPIHNIEIFPNPTNGTFFIDLESIDDPVDIIVFSADGKIINDLGSVNSKSIEVKLGGDSGIYLVQISSKGFKRVFKVQKI